MSSKPSIFGGKQADLGTSIDTSIGVSVGGVNSSFSNPDVPARMCIYCTAGAGYKIVPKKPHLDNEEIRNKGYVCEHCLKQGYLVAEDYGIREM